MERKYTIPDYSADVLHQLKCDEKGNYNKSPIEILATIINENASYDLQEALKTYRQTGETFGFRLHETQIYAANIMLTVEEMVSTGFYNHSVFATRVNKSLGEYGIISNRQIKIEEEDNKNIVLESDFKEEILKQAIANPTLSDFIESPFTYLPNKLITTLNKQGVIMPIMNIAPIIRGQSAKVVTDFAREKATDLQPQKPVALLTARRT